MTDKWAQDIEDAASKQANPNLETVEARDAYTRAFIDLAFAEATKKKLIASDDAAPTLNDLAAIEGLTKDLGASIKGEITVDAQLNRLRTIEAPYPADKAAREVAEVIGAFKYVDPRLIAAADPLTKYRFSLDEKRAMSWLLNMYYWDRGYRMAQLIHPLETQGATHVMSFVAVVQRHRPHPV